MNRLPRAPIFASALLSLALYASPASARGVLIWVDSSKSEGWTNTAAVFTSLGASPVTVTSTWPSSLDSYDLVVLALPTTTVPTTTVTQLQSLVARDGVVFLVSDYSSWYSGTTYLNNVLSSLGAGSRFVATGYDYGCRTDGTVMSSHALVSGISSSFGFGASSTMTLDSDATQLARGPSSQVLIGVEGNVVFSTD